jgi:hypothetical protein
MAAADDRLPRARPLRGELEPCAEINAKLDRLDLADTQQSLSTPIPRKGIYHAS